MYNIDSTNGASASFRQDGKIKAAPAVSITSISVYIQSVAAQRAELQVRYNTDELRRAGLDEISVK